MKKLCMIGAAALLASAPAAFAGMPMGQVTGYITSEKIDLGGGNDDSATGFGFRGWASVNGPWFVHGEYQAVGFDGGDINQLRLGGGFAGEMSKGTMWLVKAEYIDTGSDLDQAGFGVHGGLMFNASDAVGLFGTLGYITTDDTDGLEIDVGGKFAFTKEWGGVIDFRDYFGSVDPNGDFKLSDLRFGVSYSFY